MGTIGIEWRGVLRVTSPQTFDVDTGTSARFEGSFPESGQDGVINVSRAPQDVQILERIDIVRIRSLDKNFWDRLDARVDFGLSVTRANRIATYNLSSEASYEMQGATTQVTYSSFLTSQQDLETLARNQLGSLMSAASESAGSGSVWVSFSKMKNWDCNCEVSAGEAWDATSSRPTTGS